MSDLISRQAAIDECDKQYPNIDRQDFKAVINAVPSADRPTVDCTKFMEWLKEEVLDEENWELNAVANGEVICRKLKKLGWLDVEDGYYVDTRPTVDKEYLIDLIQEAVYDGEACAKLIDLVDRPTGKWVRLEREENVYDIHGVPTWGVNYMCDKCGFITTAIQDHFAQYRWCPSCGAKMKGGDDE